jgi:hypothetical protein
VGGPSWNKVGQVFTAAQGEFSSLYWPWVLDRGQYPALSSSFVGRYVMYYSTDHGAGGVAVATADNPAGPWTNHGQVFNDAGPGFSTETPSVWWDPQSSLFRMFYQQAGVGASQSTLQATSAEGLSWSKLPQANGILGQPGPFPGDGHTGYAIPSAGPGLREMVAYHLMGGGDRPCFGMSVSKDHGATWRTDPRPLMYGWDQVQPVAPGMRIEWNSGHVREHDGRRWWVGLISNFSSGGGAVSRHIVQAPLSDDGRRLLGVPEKVFPTDPASNLRAVFLLQQPTSRWLYYQVGNTISVAEAVA